MNRFTTYKNIWNVSFPIILSGVAQNIVNVTDTAFLGRVGIVELGAAGNAGIFYMVLMMIGLGFTVGCQIIMGRRNGEGNLNSIGDLFNSGLFFLLPLALVLFCFLYFLSPLLLSNLMASPEVLEASNQFLQVRSFGIFFAFFNFLFIAFYTGTTKTQILIKVTFLQSAVNVIFDYLLIFGYGGFPEMGIRGAALASVISEVCALLYFFYYTTNKVDYKAYGLFQHLNFDPQKLKKILVVASPIMLQNFLALTTWLTFFMIIEQMGEKELAVSHIIRSIYMVVMIPLFGFSSAASTLVSNVMGQGRMNEVYRVIKKIVVLSLCSTLIFIPFMLLFPHSIIRIYTDDVSLIEAALPIMYVIAGAMALFSISYILFSSVTGTGKTLMSMCIEITSISIYLTLAYLLGLYFQLPLSIVWCSEFIYFTMMGTLSILYLKFGDWKNSNI